MGLQKRGKNHFAFTMPKKWNGRSELIYMQLDNNFEHVLRGARERYGKNSIQHLSYTSTNPTGDLKTDARQRWERFVRDYEYVVRKHAAVVVDTMTELNDLRKVAEFGRTTQIMQIFYGSLYNDYRWMVSHALANDANVLFLHRAKDEYVDDKRTGNYRLDGWPGMAFEAQMLLEHLRDDEGHFSTVVRDSAQDPMLMGLELTGEENDFPSIAAKVYRTTSADDWRK